MAKLSTVSAAVGAVVFGGIQTLVVTLDGHVAGGLLLLGMLAVVGTCGVAVLRTLRDEFRASEGLPTRRQAPPTRTRKSANS